MLTNNEIIEFINKNDYIVKSTNIARWIDQKCAPDVLTIVADCIYNYALKNSNKKEFTTFDIWHFEYTINNVSEIFKKPQVESKNAKHEYDKFFQQPMELLSSAKILNKRKSGRSNIYSIKNKEILEYIALREKNSLFFLKTYIEKTLKDNQIYYLFENFFKNQDSISYTKLKNNFCSFLIENTKINTEVECRRIFIKVLNPLSYFQNSRGTSKGHLSKDKITYDMLMYNRNNFRDIYSQKPKNIARKEHIQNQTYKFNTAYCNYQSNKAKRFLHLFNEQYRQNKSEHYDEFDNGAATQIHHIFPQNEYPQISSYLENLIALTPTQHLTMAHPNNKTSQISKTYQHLLLLSKIERIKENLLNNDVEKIYEFSKFLYVLSIGFKNENILNLKQSDFNSIINIINTHYSAQN